MGCFYSMILGLKIWISPSVCRCVGEWCGMCAMGGRGGLVNTHSHTQSLGQIQIPNSDFMALKATSWCPFWGHIAAFHLHFKSKPDRIKAPIVGL